MHAKISLLMIRVGRVGVNSRTPEQKAHVDDILQDQDAPKFTLIRISSRFYCTLREDRRLPLWPFSIDDTDDEGHALNDTAIGFKIASHPMPSLVAARMEFRASLSKPRRSSMSSRGSMSKEKRPLRLKRPGGDP